VKRTGRSLLPGSDNSPAACAARIADAEARDRIDAARKELDHCLWLEAASRNWSDKQEHINAVAKLAAARELYYNLSTAYARS